MQHPETTARFRLTKDQVSAATRLHSRLHYWEATDKALDHLAARFRAFDLSASLLKTLASDHAADDAIADDLVPVQVDRITIMV
jgi:hypothetical protein